MASAPVILAVDLASGGASASLMDARLRALRTSEIPWTFVPDRTGAATLSATAARDALATAVRTAVEGGPPPEAIVPASMMHTLVVTDRDGAPRTPVFTWQDRRTGSFEAAVRDALGPDYTERTGAYFHPSFPAFKLAALRRLRPPVLSGDYLLASLRSFIQASWTGNRAEDISTAAASGLFNQHQGAWDARTVEVLGLDASALPALRPSSSVAGRLSDEAAARLGLAAGLPVVAGGGDGFMATIGSGATVPERIAATLGTTASVRRFVDRVPAALHGAFCYRYAAERYLLGCASSNGGNVLEWARTALGEDEPDSAAPGAIPIFLPFLNGERSPFWDARLRARWLEVSDGTTVADLRQAAVEGIAFQMAAYFEIVTGISGAASSVILSGNGFAYSNVASILAALLPVPVFEPPDSGLATLRGAARCGFEALGIATDGAIEEILAAARRVSPEPRPGLYERFERFKAAYDQPVSGPA